MKSISMKKNSFERMILICTLSFFAGKALKLLLILQGQLFYIYYKWTATFTDSTYKLFFLRSIAQFFTRIVFSVLKLNKLGKLWQIYGQLLNIMSSYGWYEKVYNNPIIINLYWIKCRLSLGIFFNWRRVPLPSFLLNIGSWFHSTANADKVHLF